MAYTCSCLICTKIFGPNADGVLPFLGSFPRFQSKRSCARRTSDWYRWLSNVVSPGNSSICRHSPKTSQEWEATPASFLRCVIWPQIRDSTKHSQDSAIKGVSRMLFGQSWVLVRLRRAPYDSDLGNGAMSSMASQICASCRVNGAICHHNSWCSQVRPKTYDEIIVWSWTFRRLRWWRSTIKVWLQSSKNLGILPPSTQWKEIEMARWEAWTYSLCGQLNWKIRYRRRTWWPFQSTFAYFSYLEWTCRAHELKTGWWL